MNFALIFLLGLAAHVESQTCDSMYPCSSNAACECIPLVFSENTGICGISGVNCARLSPCDADYSCSSANQICVSHSRCGSTPICYPMSMADARLCPPMDTTTTTATDSTQYYFNTTATISYPSHWIRSMYSSELTINSPKDSSTDRYYELIQIHVNTSGEYQIRSVSNMDTYACIYDDMKNSSELTNSTDCNDDYNGNQFQLNIYLEEGIAYILNLTTYAPHVTGPYIIEVYGEDVVEFSPIYDALETTTPYRLSLDSLYFGFLDSNSPKYSQNSRYYKAVNLQVNTSGYYIIRSEGVLDSMGYLYLSYFNPSNDGDNLLAHDDQSGGNNQFSFTVYLEADVSYVLVFTTYNPNIIGNFKIVVSGPAVVRFTSIENIEETSTTPSILYELTTEQTNDTDSSLVITEYSSELTIANRYFQRPSGHTGNFYYEAIQINVYLNGLYTFTSELNNTNFIEETTIGFASDNDTLTNGYVKDSFGCMYEDNFSPISPLVNLIQSDDDSGMNRQFRITQRLQADRSYVLVYTTYGEDTFGSFSIKASGPYYVEFYPLSDV